MRLAFVFLLVLHGLAHLVGFLAPLGLTPRAALGPPEPAPILGGRVRLRASAPWLGILWLLGAIAFVYAAYRLGTGSPGAMVPLLVATGASLVLTAVWWPMSRIGLLVNLFILAVVAATAIVGFRRDMRAAWARVTGVTQVVRTSLGPVEYAERGAGDPVLVVHGTGGGFDQSLYATRELTGFNCRLIAPSRFGYLGTPMRADASPALEARQFAELLDSLGVRRVAVVSFSAGTAPAVQFALRYPQRVSALVLVVPAAGGMVPVTHPNPPPRFMMNVALKYDAPMWLTWKLAPSVVHRLMAVPPALVPTLARDDREDLDEGAMTLFPVSARFRGTLYDARTQAGNEALYPLEQVTTPTLLVSAADDLYGTLENARAMAARIPEARVLAYPTGGHMLAGRRAEVWPAVASFMGIARGRSD
jgi:2-hydroxy-6-oxonona-2,4-dienedioate hydrolase